MKFKNVLCAAIALAVSVGSTITCVNATQEDAVGFIKDSTQNLKAEKCFVVETTGFTPDEKVITNSNWDLFTCEIDDRVHEGSEVFVMFDTKGTEKRTDDEITSVVKPTLPTNWLEESSDRKIYEHATTIGYENGVTKLLLNGEVFEYESPYYGIGIDVYLEMDHGRMPYFMADDKVLKMYDFWELLEMHNVDDLDEFNGGIYAWI